jgi:transmembrane sensor
MTVSSAENEADMEAFAWVVRIEDAARAGTTLTDKEQREFEAWLAASRQHQGAYIRARAASEELDHLASFQGGQGIGDPPERPCITRRHLIAAGLSGAALVGVGGWLGRQRVEDFWRGERYLTAVGEVKRVLLMDGSELMLNTATEVFVSYKSSRREIALTRGEVLVTVALDLRPFVVRFAKWAVLVVRAVFAVRWDAIGDVIVEAGEVGMVSTDSSVSRQSQSLIANQIAVIDETGVVTAQQLSHVQVGHRLAWRIGMVIFDGQPLGEAVREMNRYSTRQIACDDPALTEHHVVGNFKMADMETFVSAAATQFGAQVVHEGNTLHLRRRVH